jgi:hypothetical protein
LALKADLEYSLIDDSRVERLPVGRSPEIDALKLEVNETQAQTECSTKDGGGDKNVLAEHMPENGTVQDETNESQIPQKPKDVKVGQDPKDGKKDGKQQDSPKSSETMKPQVQSEHSPTKDNKEEDVPTSHTPGTVTPKDEVKPTQLPRDYKFIQVWTPTRQREDTQDCSAESSEPTKPTLYFCPRRQNEYLTTIEDPRNSGYTKTGFPIANLRLTNDELHGITDVFRSEICPKMMSREATDRWEKQYAKEKAAEASSVQKVDEWKEWKERVMQPDPHWRPLNGGRNPKGVKSSSTEPKSPEKEEAASTIGIVPRALGWNWEEKSKPQDLLSILESPSKVLLCVVKMPN